MMQMYAFENHVHARNMLIPLIDTSFSKSTNLWRTRDLLLSRLVSGEVGVEAVHE